MSNLALWSPPSWGNLVRRQSPFAELDNWLRDFFGSNEWINADFSPAAEVTRDGDDAVVRVELPGVDVEKDVNVELENGQLVIHGERRDEHTSKDTAKNGIFIHELRYGSFRRSFALPSHVDSDAISASYDKGVLTIKVPGAYKDQPLPGAKRIPISK